MDLLIALTVFLAAASARPQVNNRKVVLGNNGETYNLEGFSSYNKLIRELEDYSSQKLKESFPFILRVAATNSTSFISFVTQDKFITMQLLYALSNKDVVYANLLIHLCSSFVTEKSETLRRWLDSSINFNKTEIYEIVKFIVRKKENGVINIPRYLTDQLVLMNKKYQIFETACFVGDKDIVEWFIVNGLDLHTVSCNILENTWNRQQISVLKVLLENNYLTKINLTHTDLNRVVNDKTLVHIAAEFGLVESLVTLVKYGADINIKDSKGRTPLFSAILSNELSMMKILVGLGADTSVVCKDTGDSILHVATSMNNVDAVGEILQLGVQVNSRNFHGETALYKAVMNENVKIIYVLGFQGGDIDFTRPSGDSLLHLAASSGNINVVKTLLLLGSKNDVKNDLGESPLYSGAKNGHINIINMLISNGADILEKDRKGMTLLHRAAKLGDITAASTLLNSGLELDIRGIEGVTPLYCAVDEGHRAITKFLLQKGANPNAVSNGGWSPLHRAALWGFEDIVALLLGHGANPSLTTNSGWTPYALAMEYGHRNIHDTIKSRVDVNNTDTSL